MIKQKLIDSLRLRAATELRQKNRQSFKFLCDVSPEDYVNKAVQILYLFSRAKRKDGGGTAYMVEVCATIGHAIMRKYMQPMNSAVATRVGCFILYSMQDIGLVSLFKGRGSNGHATYIIHIENEMGLKALWDQIPSETADTTFPSKTPFADWVSSRHSENNIPIIKTYCKEVLKSVNPERHPIPFDVLNKAQKIGWLVNKEILAVAKTCLMMRSSVFSGIWKAQKKEARITKIRETRQILDIATKMGDDVFYHQYYFDFRGRKYPSTAYLHEQGSDLSRGLLMLADKAPVTLTGFKWLLIYIASTWGGDTDSGVKTDKLPLHEREAWTLANESRILACAEDPLKNKDWMAADKPWQFLAAIKELRNLRKWQKEHNDYNNYDYETGVCAYIDGSNNGCQHLAALAKDEETAAHVNLTVRKDAGDLYGYVAQHLWEHIQDEVDKLPDFTIRRCNGIIDYLVDIKQRINIAEGEERRALIEELNEFRSENRDMINVAAPVFWSRIEDRKKRRKIVKRNVMTIPYGGTAYGLGQQQIDDGKKHGIDLLLYMEYRWGSYLGRTVFADCRKSLQKPMQLLKLFEEAGNRAEEAGEFLRWTVPCTNFPVVQYYTEGKVIKTWVPYGPDIGEKTSTGYQRNWLQLLVCYPERPILSKGKQAQGAAPNAIHSLDAGHLMLVVHTADFPVVTIHDSYGCRYKDMERLFHLVREKFVELYASDPLSHLVDDLGVDGSKIELGTFNVEEILNSEYGFS